MHVDFIQPRWDSICRSALFVEQPGAATAQKDDIGVPCAACVASAELPMDDSMAYVTNKRLFATFPKVHKSVCHRALHSQGSFTAGHLCRSSAMAGGAVAL